eukprot:COSAG02_NODE_1145_length_14241_cov_3.363951_3_plen_76_part_00
MMIVGHSVHTNTIVTRGIRPVGHSTTPTPAQHQLLCVIPFYGRSSSGREGNGGSTSGTGGTFGSVGFVFTSRKGS